MLGPAVALRVGDDAFVMPDNTCLIRSLEKVGMWHSVTPDLTCSCESWHWRGYCRHQAQATAARMALRRNQSLKHPLPEVDPMPQLRVLAGFLDGYVAVLDGSDATEVPHAE